MRMAPAQTTLYQSGTSCAVQVRAHGQAQACASTLHQLVSLLLPPLFDLGLYRLYAEIAPTAFVELHKRF